MERLPTTQSDERNGAALAEAACTLPVILVLVFGAIEAADAIHQRQAVSVAAYDVARIATKPLGTTAEARQRGEQLLNSLGIKGYVISFSEEVNSTTASGTVITVVVTAPARENTLGLLPLFRNLNFRKAVHMARL